MQKGILVNVVDRGLSMSGKYALRLVKSDDGLVRRPRSNWAGHYTNCDVGAMDVWFQSVVTDEDLPPDDEEEDDGSGAPRPPPSVVSGSGGGSGERKIEKSFFFSLENIQYNREIGATTQHQTNNSSLAASVSAEAESVPSNFLTVTGMVFLPLLTCRKIGSLGT
jgi:hypothetical protein